MTCIVCVKKNGKVVLAADSLTTVDNLKLKHLVNDTKIFDFPSFHVAIAGEGSIIKILEDILAGLYDTQETCWSCFNVDNKRHCTVFIEFVRAMYEDTLESGVEANFEFLIITKNKRMFWYWTTDANVYELKDFWASGSGGEFALGCLYGLYSQIDHAITIGEAAEIAVKSACYFHNECEDPVELRIID